MVERVLSTWGDGYSLESQDQIITRLHIMVIPDIYQISILTIKDEGNHEAHRPLHSTHSPLMLTSLLLRAMCDAKGPDQISHNMLYITVIVSPGSSKSLFIQMVQEIIPFLPDSRNLGANLHTCQDVIESAEVNHGVDGRPQPCSKHASIAQAAAHLRITVQSHCERDITVINRVIQRETLIVMRLWQIKTRNNLLNPMWDVQICVLTGLIPRLSIGVRL